ncbi:MAG: GPW/gp25 family protein [Chloroflexota bacterium]
MRAAHEFVGRGWAFPLRTDASGNIALVSADREIEEAIRLIIGTAYGERPMRPDFGCAIHDYVYAGADAATAAQIAHEVRRSLRRWEPRIDLHAVDTTIDQDDHSLIYIDIRYTVKATNDPRNLVFPFYVIPEED